MSNQTFTWVLAVGMIIPFLVSYLTMYYLANKKNLLAKCWWTGFGIAVICIGLTLLFAFTIPFQPMLIISVIIWSIGMGVICGLITYKLFYLRKKGVR